MLKFIVVLYRRPDVTLEQFQRILSGQHAALAEQLLNVLKQAYEQG